jgi:hypothetical protein
MSNLTRYSQFDLSGGIQNATSFLMKKKSEIADMRNGRFGVELGAIVRRNGHDRVGNTFGSGSQNTPTGGFVAKFSTGNVRFVAVNDSGSTATIVRTQPTSGGSWTTLTGIPSIPINARVNFLLYLDEVYVTGYDPATGDPITPFNVNSSLNVSTTRNINTMPACRYLVEYAGALFACNVKIGSTRYRDRAYKSSGPLGAITYINSAQSGVLTTITLDSVRYIKSGMALDIYDAGTETKLYDITVTAVDKSLNKITFVPYALTFATSAVNTTSEEITLSSAALFPTGTPVVITSTTTVPAGLTSGTTYYSIYVNATTIKLATSAANATAGTAINITSQGTGTHTITLSYVLSDNDEIWLDGRKGTLNVMWNQDFPNPEESDWTATLPGTDSSNEITAVGKSSNRLFLFTKNSGQKYDGANTVTFNNAVGCVSHGSLKNIDDDWTVWLDAKARVWARNESNGQQEYISRGIYQSIMKYVPAANLAAATAVVNNNIYYLYLGQVDVGKGNEYLRVVYSFDDNVWAVDRLPRQALFSDNDDYTGSNLPYFWCDDGYLYIDDTGNLDYQTEIPLEIDFGRDNFGGVQLKKFDSMFIYSKDAAGTTVKVSVSGKQPMTVGEITEDECYIKFPERGEDAMPRGSSINAFLYGTGPGLPPSIQGIEWYFASEEDSPSDRRPR